MANITRTFISGKMNKVVDERLVPNGEYIDALNIRMGSTEGSEIGVIENSKGNVEIAKLQYLGSDLSDTARCIGAFEDGAEETIYWFVHDNNNPLSPTSKVDMVVSYDTKDNIIRYHVISVNDGGGVDTTLNFNPKYLITGVNKISDLLFFTDNYNPPREINVERTYPYPLSGVDQTSAESLMVIKKPPIQSPNVQPFNISSQNNFLEDRFLCFAYRYRYEDGGYSATSQFSAPSFVPSDFGYDISTALNSGMINSSNACEITYNSGGPLVKSIDLLFKDMNNSIIKVIEKLDKSDLGLANDTEYSYTFSNSKIFTILPDSEILRLYDNVPRLAQAQTLMSNRLFYGNYVEGYDLLDKFNAPLKLEYTTELQSDDIGFEQIEPTLDSATYLIDTSTVIPNARFDIDLSGKDLKAGSSISILITFDHHSWSGQTPFPTQVTDDEDLNFTYFLPQDFSSVYELATSNDFIEKIGLATNIQTVDNSCNGTTLTDQFNCTIPSQLGALYKYESGVNAIDEPISIITSPASDVISLIIPAMKFVDDPTGVAITQTAYEYYTITLADITFQKIGNPKSLHSNRGYEVGIVYMDEFSRMTSALVSPNNTVHVPCSSSGTKNSIVVNIPDTQIAPEWASRYKFVIKPDKKDYDVIYSNFFFTDPSTGFQYFLLEGQNSSKIQEGDELIVKADASGIKKNCTWTTVLEKQAKSRDFLDPKPVDGSGNDISVPGGTYMKLKANNFDTDVSDSAVINYGEYSDVTDDSGCKCIYYPVSMEDPNNPGNYIDYTIPSGSQIRIKIINERPGNEDSAFGNVSRKYWAVDNLFIASQNYSNFKQWFEGDNIASALESLSNNDGTDVEGPEYSSLDLICSDRPCNINRVYTNFFHDSNDNSTSFLVKSSKGYNGDKKSTDLTVQIEVVRANNLIIFESDPQDAEPDLWYESSESFAIDSQGQHQGNVQDQDFTLNEPAIINTDFFNCFAFGNGVESYKAQDSIVGKELVLGNRVTTTEAKEYKEARRYSDLTYSSIYNEESNVNKLNEFNLGLLNFRLLEQSFGPVQKLFARQTDILILQEDKISYVLAGKNILSDASGGSALTSVPEVIGTQIARIEEFGISHHAESFAQWGSDKYFTDAKRGVVLKLSGGSYSSDQLDVISSMGMRTWFRDLFNESFDTQKLGGFDPYMNEYVLSSNNIDLPLEEPCLSCGSSQVITLNPREEFNFCSDVGNLVGELNIVYNVISGKDSFYVTAEYDETTYTSGEQTTSGVLTFDKDKVEESIANISLYTNGSVTLEVTVQCPNAEDINVILVHVNSDSDEGLSIHDEYRWNDGIYQSPLHSQIVNFSGGTQPVVSMYQLISGPQGGGVIPSNTAVVSMISNKFNSDTYSFDRDQDKFKYLRTDTVYGNNPTDIGLLLSQSTAATPIVPSTLGEDYYKAEFNMPLSGQNLYLIWDYRNSTQAELCYDETIYNACCGCD